MEPANGLSPGPWIVPTHQSLDDTEDQHAHLMSDRGLEYEDLNK